MNEDKGYMITCSRCGAEMNSNARYCMKCGNLNSNHEANKSMMPYIENNQSVYQVGSGNFINNDSNHIQTGVANNTGSRSLCFFVNLIIYLLFLFVMIFLTYSQVGSFDLDFFSRSALPLSIVILSVSFLYLYSLQLVYIKCNKRWWACFVPIYNLMVLSEITFHNKYLGLLSFVPIIGQIYIIIMLYKLGDKFQFNGFLTALLPFVFVPIIGFGSHTYEGRTFVSIGDEKSLEKDYRRSKTFLETTVLFLLIGIALLVYGNFNTIKEKSEETANKYFVLVSHKFVDKVKEKINSKDITCTDYEYVSDEGLYYFYYSDLRDAFYLPLSIFNDVIEGVVVVDNRDGTSKYYVSLSDGTKGFPSTLIENVNDSTVVEYPSIDIDFSGYNSCRME